MRIGRTFVLTAAVVGLATVLPSGFPTAAAAASGGFAEYNVLTPGSRPLSMVTGPDGAVWFTEFGAGKIGRITPEGVVSEYQIPTPNSQPDEIDVGPDGNLWFAEVLGNKIGRMTPGGLFTEYVVPTPDSRPTVVAPGPDGNVWFTERGTVTNPGQKVGYVTPGGVVREFSVPTPQARPLGITAGADGNMWFTEERGNKIGRIEPATGAITEFPLPNLRSQPFEITAGPDGNLWFTQFNGNRIGRMTTDGVLTEYPVPTPGSGPNTIRRGPDPNAATECALRRSMLGDAEFAVQYGTFGSCVSRLARTGTLWFTETAANRIAYITTDGFIAEYAIPTSGAQPIGITQGWDGAVWFAESAAIVSKIGRLEVQSVGQPIAPGIRAGDGDVIDPFDG